jgi:hypothetical protein
MIRLVLLVLCVSSAVTAQDLPETVRDVPMVISPPMPPRATARAEAAAVDLSAPPDFQGMLDDNDPQREGGRPYEAHTFSATLGHEVTVTMTAADFDTYLIVRSPSGQEWSNDDFGDTRTSQVSFTASTSGAYTVWASAYTTDGRGAYEVRVSTRAARILSTVEGRLDYEDAQQIKGEYFDTLTIRPPTSGTFYVELMPLGFRGYLRVTSPDGQRHVAESAWDARSVRVGPLQGAPGAWTVDITTMERDQVGAYDLRVTVLDEQ